MAYTDIVGSSGSDAIILNDLDLSVDITSELTRNNFNSGREDDDYKHVSQNTVEMVHIENPSPRTNYTITVTAKSLVAEQAFSIVITGDISNFHNRNLQNNKNPAELIFSIGKSFMAFYLSLYPVYKLTILVLFLTILIKLLWNLFHRIYRRSK